MDNINPTLFYFLTILITLLSTTFPIIAQNSPQDFLDAHNYARAEVGVGPLVWDDDVAAFAEYYVSWRLADCAMEHSGVYYGENLASGTYLTGVEAVEMWIAEKPNYDYYWNMCVGGECLHYTQVVWRDSVRLGCARAQCYNGWWFVSCNYDPPGNYEGQRPYDLIIKKNMTSQGI